MSIIKKKAKKKNFSIIDNEGILDKTLSWKATGLWTWLMSKPDTWEVNLENLCRSKTDGKDSVLSALAELETSGYLVYQRWRNPNGQFESSYTVFESPEQLDEWLSSAEPEEISMITKVAKKGKSNEPLRENHCGKTTAGKPLWLNHCGKTTAENPLLVNIDIESTESVNTKQVSTEKQNPLTPKMGEPSHEKVVSSFSDKATEQDQEDQVTKVEVVDQSISSLKDHTELNAANEFCHETKKEGAARDNKLLKLQSDSRKRNKRATMEELQCFLDAYLTHKPSIFVEHQDLSEKHVDAINRLITEHKGDEQRALEIFTAALIRVREQNDKWWRVTKNFTLSNFMSNKKITDLASEHWDAMRKDPDYRDRVEGRSPSKDPKFNNGFGIFDEQGNQLTGATAEAVSALIEDPELAIFLGNHGKSTHNTTNV